MGNPRLCRPVVVNHALLRTYTSCCAELRIHPRAGCDSHLSSLRPCLLLSPLQLEIALCHATLWRWRLGARSAPLLRATAAVIHPTSASCAPAMASTPMACCELTASSPAAADNDDDVLGQGGQLRRPPPRFADIVAIITSTLPAARLDSKAVRLTCKEALLAHDRAQCCFTVVADKLPAGQEGAAQLARSCGRLVKGGPQQLRVRTASAADEVSQDHL